MAPVLIQPRGQNIPNSPRQHILSDSAPKQPRYSPSKLGSFCVPNFCSRCAWRLLQMRDRKPYNFPPAAVLNKLDAHQKQLARIALEDGSLPAFFGECADAIEVLDVPSLSCITKTRTFSCIANQISYFGCRRILMKLWTAKPLMRNQKVTPLL